MRNRNANLRVPVGSGYLRGFLFGTGRGQRFLRLRSFFRLVTLKEKYFTFLLCTVKYFAPVRTERKKRYECNEIRREGPTGIQLDVTFFYHAEKYTTRNYEYTIYIHKKKKYIHSRWFFCSPQVQQHNNFQYLSRHVPASASAEES